MKAALFDFDNTLTHGDTLPIWLAILHGWPMTLAAYAVAGCIGWAIPATSAGDARGRIKALLLRLLLRGAPTEKAAAAGAAMHGRVKWREDICQKLRDHHARGHRVVIVTGAATLYLPGLLECLPIDEIIGTTLETREGRLTGRIAGANCVRGAKAEAARRWLERHRPDETWGYGNAPHDLEMLSLLNHQFVV